MKTQAPCGSWPSPITAAIVAGKTPRLGEPHIQTIDDNKHRLFWVESQLNEKGRLAIMMQDGENIRCILPNPLNCRSKVHEYGGGSYCVHGDTLYFVLADDQRIYRGNISANEFIPEPITPNDGRRYGDLVLDHKHNRLIAVCENHKKDNTGSEPDNSSENSEPENSLLCIHLDSRGNNGKHQITPLVSGDDFYAYPRISPCGNKICWVSWNHPNMPWDATALWQANFDSDGTVCNKTNIIAEKIQSVFQPLWSPNNELYFVSDQNNWWNLYRVDSSNPESIIAVTQLESEFATPLWVLGMSCYGFINAHTILATSTQNGLWQLNKIDINPSTGQVNIHKLSTEKKPELNSISSISTGNNVAAFIGANPTTSPQVFKLTDTITPITKTPSAIDSAQISQPVSCEFPSGNGEKAYAFYYAPTHQQYLPDAAPPMIFICHGGPTGATDTALNPKIQYWTNRGFAVMDVNYRGSTGYGRNYRNRLHKNWGVIDIEDMCTAADYAIQQGWASPDKLIIKGSSAGGYTVLASLCFSQRFNAGVSLYGIGDLEALVRDTHKFEARYLDNLVGDWHNEHSLYVERSPIHSVEKINCPILVFQGLEDKVVPPNQAEKIVNAVANKGLPVAYVTFEDEGHGFRNPKNIETMLNAELSFYCQVFQLPHPEDLPKLNILNMDKQ